MYWVDTDERTFTMDSQEERFSNKEFAEDSNDCWLVFGKGTRRIPLPNFTDVLGNENLSRMPGSLFTISVLVSDSTGCC